MTLVVLTLCLQVASPAESSQVKRDMFGVCVDRAGDLNQDGVQDFWVGDPSNRSWPDPHYGKAWAVSGKDGVTLRRIDSPPEAYDFGWTLAGIGDVDKDAVLDVAVGCLFMPSAGVPSPGARVEGSSPDGETAVHVYSGADGSLKFALRGPAEDLKVGGYSIGAGPSLAPVGDWNDDGVADFAVGWAYGDSDVMDCGRVDVVSGAGGQTIKSWNGLELHDRFGSSLASLPDLDGDGKPELAAGAVPDRDFREQAPASLRRARSGYVRVLSSKGSVLRTLFPFSSGRHFGLSVAPFHEGRAGAEPQLLVGQPFDGPSTGVTRWSLSDGSEKQMIARPEIGSWDNGWERAHAILPSTEVEESFGTRLLAVPDRDGDGNADILITAPQSLSRVPACIVSSATGKPIGRIQLDAIDVWGFSHIGIGGCFAGDVDGDGVEDFALSGASIRCWECEGTVILVSGKTLKVVRHFLRRGRT